MEQELSIHQFLRIYRSYIINTSKITAFTSHDIDVNTQEIPIGASCYSLFRTDKKVSI